ncbi:MAG TPA: PilT/PilU family type 4a pilus ATPase, partial [Steroidobacteraceae bacterium]|nr:PilT/PilU family type 4a pilus ATPase [Steroidobacteraceae bacterium]
MDRDQAIKLMQELLKRVVERQASDLFITAGFPPAIKVDGEVRPQMERALSSEQSALLVRAIMNDRQTREFDATKECNFAIAPPGIGRFRVSAFVQQSHVGCVIRLINAKIPTFEELDLPPVLKEVVLSKRGFVIVVGGTGSGKSTTLASMVGYRNDKTRGHIVTIEDPVEFVHQHRGCVITHREVGVDTESWHTALRNTLRQAPDVILIGEIRDRETMEYGIQFAETGHLVLATLHANSSNQALDRIVNFFPEERREQLLMDLSLNVRALISQRLIPREAGAGRIAAMVGYRNEKTRGHIVTIEDPVEYVHAHKGCVVTHREVGVDCESWHLALKNTLRQAPDVILIGEIRDRETMEYGIQFAETGHLVLATLHANSSNQALDRIINFFP